MECPNVKLKYNSITLHTNTFFSEDTNFMPYKLPCSCGSFVPVETNQAGRPVQCQCGNSLQVPSLSQIKNLEPFSEQGSLKTQKKSVSPKSPSRWIQAKHICLIVGFVFFVVMGLLFVRGVMHYPKLHDVCTMNRFYVHDGKVIGRDTQPISHRDFRLIVDERIAPPCNQIGDFPQI